MAEVAPWDSDAPTASAEVAPWDSASPDATDDTYGGGEEAGVPAGSATSAQGFSALGRNLASLPQAAISMVRGGAAPLAGRIASAVSGDPGAGQAVSSAVAGQGPDSDTLGGQLLQVPRAIAKSVNEAPTALGAPTLSDAASQGFAAVARQPVAPPGVPQTVWDAIAPAQRAKIASSVGGWGGDFVNAAASILPVAGAAARGLGALDMAGAETSTIEGFGQPRPEPTAPSSPGGFTRDDFAPRPAPAASPEPASAANAPTPATRGPPSDFALPGPGQPSRWDESQQRWVDRNGDYVSDANGGARQPGTPARPVNPVPGKPHIRPKAVPAGEPTPAAPETPAAPSAAPDAAGNPPPDIHDPGFFPSPDNQDLKAAPAGPKEQATRQAAVERGAPTLPQVRDSAITNDYAAQGRDWTGKQAGDPAATAQIAAEGQALHSEASRISGETGGQLGTGESADTVRGKAYQDWHDSTVAALQHHIDQAYASEDAQAKQIATPGSNLKGVLTDDSLIDNANAGSARSSTIALGKKMGVDLTDPNAQLNAYQVENLRKHANSIYGNAPRFAQAIKNAADADLPPGAYQKARALRTLKGQLFDNRDGINQLGASKDIDPNTGNPRPENRPVKAPDVMKKIESMDPDQVRHIVGTMKNSSTILDRLGDPAAAASITDKALKAAQQLQSHFTERWADEASKGGGWNQRRAHQFLKNNQETLAATMSPEQMHQMRNVSNAANVMDLDKRYKGAFAQFRTGASWLRQKLGRTAEGMITDMIPMGNTLGEMSGLSEGLRNKLGGKNVAEAPKNFTRPLGETVGGGKQRGAVGHLNPPGVVHDYEPSTGHHEVQSPNGVTHANDAPNGKDIVVDNTVTDAAGRNSGEGTLRMKKLADAAADRGGKLLSDNSISPHQVPVYSSLQRMGYKVTKNPEAMKTMGIVDERNPKELAPGYLADKGDHVFSVERPSITGSPQAGATSETPLGLRPGFRRQAGAVGNLGGNPYDSAPVAKDVWGNERNVKNRTGTDRAAPAGSPYDWGGTRASNPRELSPLGQRAFGGKQRGAVGILNKAEEAGEPDTRYHTLDAAHWAQAQKQGYLDSSQYAGKKIWTSTHPSDYYNAEAGGKADVLNPGQVEVAIKGGQHKLPPGRTPDDTNDRVMTGRVPLSQVSEVRRGAEAKPEGPATVNIGLHQGDPANGGRVMKPGEATAALRSQGVKVGKTSIQTGGAEPTMVADIDRPLKESEMQNVLAKTKQSAIPQRTADGNGSISVAPGHEATAAKEGWDKYNPEYFQMHDGRSALEHDAEQKAFNDVKQHLTPAEQSDLEGRSDAHRQAAIKHMLDTFHGSTPVEGVSAMALAGQAKKGWYANAAKSINGVFGPDSPRFTALLAAMSPQTSVEMNFHNALHTYVNWDKAGRPTDPAAIKKIMEDSSLKNPDSNSESNVMDAWHQNGVRALTSADPEHEKFQLSGPKVDSFYKNLRGHTHEVTNDSWNAIATNIDQKLFSGAYRKVAGDIFGRMGFKSPTYMGVSAKVRAAAMQLQHLTGEKWTPAEVQETMWSFVKTAFEHAKATGKSIPELLKSGELNDQLIRGTSDFHSLFGAPEHKGFLDDSRFGKAAQRVASQPHAEPTAPSQASATAAKGLRPQLEAEGERLEGARQARLANRKARIGNIQVPF